MDISFLGHGLILQGYGLEQQVSVLPIHNFGLHRLSLQYIFWAINIDVAFVQGILFVQDILLTFCLLSSAALNSSFGIATVFSIFDVF